MSKAQMPKLAVYAASIFLLAATQAVALPITYTSRIAFDAAVGTSTTEDFDAYLIDTPFHTVSVDVGDLPPSSEGCRMGETLE